MNYDITPHQARLLRMIADGMTMREIAVDRDRTYETVKTNLDRARSSLDARTLAQAVAVAIRKGVIT